MTRLEITKTRVIPTEAKVEISWKDHNNNVGTAIAEMSVDRSDKSRPVWYTHDLTDFPPDVDYDEYLLLEATAEREMAGVPTWHHA